MIPTNVRPGQHTRAGEAEGVNDHAWEPDSSVAPATLLDKVRCILAAYA